MRIAYILTSLGVGGAERQVLSIGQRLHARGHSVVVITLRPPVDEQWPTHLDVLHLDMHKSPRSILAGIRQASRFLHDFKPDIVHSHGFHGNIIARLLHLLSASPAPISTIHNVYEGGLLRMLAYRLTDSHSRLTTAVSSAAAERFIRLKAVPAGKSIVLANGIDTEEFAPSQLRRVQTRAEMGVCDQFVWLAAGRLVPAKDYPNLLRAFAGLKAGCPRSRSWDLGSNPQLWIAGEPADPRESVRILQLITELQIEDSTKCLGLRRDLPALLDAADAFVLSSAWEGMPLAVGEAMSMEKPIVATDVGGTRELLGDTGTLVPAKNPQALADAMLRTMSLSAPDRTAIGHSARERIQTSFSIDAKAAEWESLYTGLISGNDSRRIPPGPAPPPR